VPSTYKGKPRERDSLYAPPKNKSPPREKANEIYVESTEPKQVYSGKLGFVSERTIKDIIIIIKGIERVTLEALRMSWSSR
jgi:hypothetical protein